MKIEKVNLSDWKSNYMKNMYLDSFGGDRAKDIERADFVLIAKDRHGEAIGFLTCHEMDSETVYWQFGGGSKKIQKTVQMMNIYISALTWSLAKYKRVTTRIENTNSPMLRMATKCGFLVFGIWNFNNRVYLELCCESGG